MADKVIEITKGLVRAEYNFWVGLYQDKFYDAFKEQKIIGNKCPKCGDVFVPPRKICGKCNVTIPLEENWVDLPNTGTLINWTATPYKVSDRSARNVKKPAAVGMVQIDGSSTAIVYRLLKMELDEIKTGMKVAIEWNKKLIGDPADIKGFVKA